MISEHSAFLLSDVTHETKVDEKLMKKGEKIPREMTCENISTAIEKDCRHTESETSQGCDNEKDIGIKKENVIHWKEKSKAECKQLSDTGISSTSCSTGHCTASISDI
jgi:hypothetical protein